jgi:hypothetical protein
MQHVLKNYHYIHVIKVPKVPPVDSVLSFYFYSFQPMLEILNMFVTTCLSTTTIFSPIVAKIVPSFCRRVKMWIQALSSS